MQVMASKEGVARRSSMQVLYKTLRQGGVRNLFFGVIPPVVIRGVSFSIQRGTIFTGNRCLDRFCSPSTRSWLHRTSIDQALCGALAGLTGVMADCPTKLLKCRAQTTKPGEHTETLRAYYRKFADISRGHGGGFYGLRGLYLGSPPLLVLNFLSWGLLYWVYDVMRQRKYHPMVAGPVSALASWPLFYPLDVLCVRIQTADPKLNITNREHYWRLLHSPVRQWYPGLAPTVVRLIPRFAITFVTLESLESLWGRGYNA